MIRKLEKRKKREENESYFWWGGSWSSFELYESIMIHSKTYWCVQGPQ